MLVVAKFKRGGLSADYAMGAEGEKDKADSRYNIMNRNRKAIEPHKNLAAISQSRCPDRQRRGFEHTW